MYAMGDFIVSREPFSSDSWGSTTVQFMDYIANDLTERHWNSIFGMLYSFSAQVTKEEEMHNCQDMVFFELLFRPIYLVARRLPITFLRFLLFSYDFMTL